MWIFLSILIFLLILLLIPVSVDAEKTEEISLKIRYFLFKFTVFPMKEKSEKKKSKPKKVKKKSKKSQDKDEKPKKKFDLDFLLEILEIVKEALGSVKNPLGYLLRHIHFRNVWLKILIAKSDAHQTALTYGKFNAMIHSVVSLMKNCVDIKIDDIQIQANFISEEEWFKGGAKLKFRPINVLIFAFWFGFSFLISYLKRKFTEKKLLKQLHEKVEK